MNNINLEILVLKFVDNSVKTFSREHIPLFIVEEIMKEGRKIQHLEQKKHLVILLGEKFKNQS